MELVIQKAVELGVRPLSRFNAVIAWCSLPVKKRWNVGQRWQKIAESAAKQCGRLVIPEVLPIAPFSEALEQVPSDANDHNALGEGDGDFFSPGVAATGAGKGCLFIGPEGGFSLEEALWPGNGAQVWLFRRADFADRDGSHCHVGDYDAPMGGFRRWLNKRLPCML